MSTRFFTRYLGDGVRANKYDVRFNIDGNEFDRMLTTLCQGTSIPSVTTQTIEYKYKGKSLNIPISYNYIQDWQCTFILDEKQEIKRFFENWIEMYGTRAQEMTFTGKSYKPVRLSNGFSFDKLSTTVSLVQYSFETEISPFNDNSKNIIAEYKLYNVFPTSVSAVNCGNDDDLLTISVDFKFSYIERVL